MTAITAIAAVAAWVRDAGTIAVLSGAGMSAESGVPTFRDAQTGLWAKFRPEELATEAAFRADPRRVWDWYASRREMMKDVHPNAGHHAIAAFQQRHPGRLTLITQNVDGLHQAAGSVGTLALHGNIFEDIWLDPCMGAPGYGGVCDVTRAQPGRPPTCADCGNALRPGVVWFGEDLPHAAIDTAFRAAETCEVFLCVGTSTLVYPAAELPFVAHRHRACVVEINPDETPLSSVADYRLAGPAGVVLPALVEALAVADAVAGQV